MVDSKFMLENLDLVKSSLAKRGSTFDLDDLVELDRERRVLIQKIEVLRKERNELGRQNSPEMRVRGKAVKVELKKLEPELTAIEEKLNQLVAQVPNIVMPETPVGKNETENVVVKTYGVATKFDFAPLDHLQIAEQNGWLDFERGAKVSGSQFYYSKGDLALLELALIRYTVDFLTQKGFTLVNTPDLAKSRYYLGTGYNPRGPEAQIYTIEGEDLGLIATAEVTLAGLHADEILNEKQLPIKYVGVSHCFRKEAGAYGKYSKGLYRVHQFTKVEMFVYCKPDDSAHLHLELLKLEEELYQGLELPFRVVEMCTGDLGSQAARKFDVEAWMPGRNDYGEVTSTSNTTDYQARRLNIKFRDSSGKSQFVHTLNGTAVTSSRVPIAIMENFQQQDRLVRIPEKLIPYFGKPVMQPSR